MSTASHRQNTEQLHRRNWVVQNHGQKCHMSLFYMTQLSRCCVSSGSEKNQWLINVDPLGEYGFRKPDPELTLDDRGGRTHWTEHKPGSGDACGISLNKVRHD